MKVREVMTDRVTSCSPNTNLTAVAGFSTDGYTAIGTEIVFTFFWRESERWEVPTS
jgi:hypothetical protein